MRSRFVVIVSLVALGSACGGSVEGDGGLDAGGRHDAQPELDASHAIDARVDADRSDGGDPCDRDGDGRSACAGEDCDDTDPNRFYGNPEVCDALAHDEDCDAITTFGPVDADGDGVVSAACCNLGDDGAWRCGLDCDDTSAGTHPGATEVCNGADDDCDGSVDEAVTSGCFSDADGDGYPPAGAARGEVCGGCPAGTTTRDPADGLVDCDDTRVEVSPGRGDDVCDAEMRDDDCDGVANDGCTCVLGEISTCCAGRGVRSCVAGSFGDCSVTAMAETCNGVDDDCDGVVDDVPGLGAVCGACGDGRRTCAGGALACVGDSAVPETCNHIDDDCSGKIDEDAGFASCSWTRRSDPPAPVFDAGWACANAVGTTASGATCASMYDSANDRVVLTDGVGSGVGALYPAVPVFDVSGHMTVFARFRVRGPSGAWTPDGGIAVALSTLGAAGAVERAGVPTGASSADRGYAARVRFTDGSSVLDVFYFEAGTVFSLTSTTLPASCAAGAEASYSLSLTARMGELTATLEAPSRSGCARTIHVTDAAFATRVHRTPSGGYPLFFAGASAAESLGRLAASVDRFTLERDSLAGDSPPCVPCSAPPL